jgi:hypothetical protein
LAYRHSIGILNKVDLLLHNACFYSPLDVEVFLIARDNADYLRQVAKPIKLQQGNCSSHQI